MGSLSATGPPEPQRQFYTCVISNSLATHWHATRVRPSRRVPPRRGLNSPFGVNPPRVASRLPVINALLTTNEHIFLSETKPKEMDETAQQRAHVMGHDGRPLTLADLPPPNTERWVIRRKAEVVAAVRGGLLSLDEACSRYTLNTDEFRSWEFCIDRYGLAGLRTTHTQFYFNSKLRRLRLRRIGELAILA
jgi:hypothetical protein